MKLILAAVFAVITVLPARAEDKAAAPAKSSWADYFKALKNNLAKSAVSGERKQVRGSQHVGAVRGKDQGYADPNEPGLKGDPKSARVKKAMANDSVFEGCVDQISGGKPEEGLKCLENFKAANPKHQTESVDKAIEGAKAMIADKGGAPAAKP